MGRWLLLGLGGGAGGGADGGFVACRPLAGGGEFAVLTTRRLLCVAAPAARRWAPALRWAAALEDLLGVRRRAAPLRVHPHSSRVPGVTGWACGAPRASRRPLPQAACAARAPGVTRWAWCGDAGMGRAPRVPGGDNMGVGRS